MAKQHKTNEATQAYLETLRGKAQDRVTDAMESKRELTRKNTLFSHHLQRAIQFKMFEANLPFWMPPVVRARDFDKFVAYPPQFQVFCYKTRASEKTLDPVWNDSCLVPGVDPESVLSLTVADVDPGDSHDDFLGQITVPLKALRFADSLALLNADQDRKDRLRAGGAHSRRLHEKRKSMTALLHVDRGETHMDAMIKADQQLKGSLLLADSYGTLGPQKVPIVEDGAAKQVHLRRAKNERTGTALLES